MNKKEFINITIEKIANSACQNIMINQIENYYNAKENYKSEKTKYNIGDDVKLAKGTLLHGTYKNIDGLKEIVKNGLISSWFIDGRLSKYPSSVGVWNLKQDYLLKDYVNFYSGGTIIFYGIFEDGIDTQKNSTSVISFKDMSNILNITSNVDCHMWTLEQTKEARFMPSLVQNRVQIGIIFNGNNDYAKNLLNGDILNPDMIDDDGVKDFVNPNYYDKFVIHRKNKDAFFTDRESAILFGLPSNLIEGVLVGRKYEKDNKILKEIKELLPNCYICNLDGKVIG